MAEPKIAEMIKANAAGAYFGMGGGMRAYRIESFGSVDGVVLGSRDDPQPGTREILVRVRATSLNYRDLMVLKGGGRGPTKLGVVPLSDGAGEVPPSVMASPGSRSGTGSSAASIRAGSVDRSSRIT